MHNQQVHEIPRFVSTFPHHPQTQLIELEWNALEYDFIDFNIMQQNSELECNIVNILSTQFGSRWK